MIGESRTCSDSSSNVRPSLNSNANRNPRGQPPVTMSHPDPPSVPATSTGTNLEPLNQSARTIPVKEFSESPASEVALELLASSPTDVETNSGLEHSAHTVASDKLLVFPVAMRDSKPFSPAFINKETNSRGSDDTAHAISAEKPATPSDASRSITSAQVVGVRDEENLTQKNGEEASAIKLEEGQELAIEFENIAINSKGSTEEESSNSLSSGNCCPIISNSKYLNSTMETQATGKFHSTKLNRHVSLGFATSRAGQIVCTSAEDSQLGAKNPKIPSIETSTVLGLSPIIAVSGDSPSSCKSAAPDVFKFSSTERPEGNKKDTSALPVTPGHAQFGLRHRLIREGIVPDHHVPIKNNFQLSKRKDPCAVRLVFDDDTNNSSESPVTSPIVCSDNAFTPGAKISESSDSIGTPEKSVHQCSRKTSTPVKDKETSRQCDIHSPDDGASYYAKLKARSSIRESLNGKRGSLSPLMLTRLKFSENLAQSGTSDCIKFAKDRHSSPVVSTSKTETAADSSKSSEEFQPTGSSEKQLPEGISSFLEFKSNPEVKQADDPLRRTQNKDDDGQEETNSSDDVSSTEDCNIACELSYQFGVEVHEFLSDRLLAMMPNPKDSFKRQRYVYTYRNRYLSAMETLTHQFVVPYLKNQTRSSSVYDFFLFHLLDHIRRAVNKRVWQGVDNSLKFNIRYVLKAGLEILSDAQKNFLRYCPTIAESGSGSSELSFDP